MFEKGDIVSHIVDINKFYIVKDDYKNGQYLVKDELTNEEFVFVAEYLLSKKDRRDYVLQQIFKKN